MKTFSAKTGEVQQGWFVVDVKGKILGRVATELARRLRGKHKAEYTAHVDTGDFHVVLNAADIQVTGNKENDKVYYRHSGYPGGLKEETLGKLRARDPVQIIMKAVKGMLPRGPLGRAMLKKLKVYAGDQHPHAAQQPQVLEI